MAVVPLKKIRLFIHKEARDSVLKELQKAGAVSFEEVKETTHLEKYTQSSFDYNRELSSVDFALSFLAKHSPEKVSFKNKIEGNFLKHTEEECDLIEKNFDYNTIVSKLQEYEADLNKYAAQKKQLTETINTLTPWSNYVLPLSNTKTDYTSSYFLLIDEGTKNYIADLLDEKNISSTWEKVDTNSFILTTLTEHGSQTKESINNAGAEIVSFPHTNETVTSLLADAKNKLIEIEQAESKIENDIQALATHRNSLKLLSDALRFKMERYEVGHSAFHTNDVLVFDGWIKEKVLPHLHTSISKITTLYEIETLPLEEGEVPPVEIENNWLVKPFETITRLYGLPGYYDLDPSLFLSAFFFIFFGLCLTDVGYGLFVMLLTGVFLAFFSLPKDTRSFVLLIFMGGLSSALIGLLFGGYLGIDIEHLPLWAQQLQTFDPVLNPLPVLFLSLGLGVFQIMFGIFLRIVREWKNNNLVDGLIGNVPWLYLFASLILFGAHAFGYLASGSSTFYTYLIYSAIVLLILTQGRHEKSFFAKGFKGVMSLYDSIAYFSDILSYSRILALGLATSALAFSVNLIAALIGDMIPVVGGALAIAILVVGHIFNLAVNILGAFIHSARLQFVEFFSKFILDSGREFRSFKRSPRFVNIE